jgi:hypothetical protein
VTELTHIPPALLTACTVLQSVTIFYPLSQVPDLERGNVRRPIRPRQVKIFARRTNGSPWYISSPIVLGHEVCKGGRLGTAERHHACVFENEHPQWLTDVVASVRAALEGQQQ